MSSIFIFCHFTCKIEGKIEDGEIRGLKLMDTTGIKVIMQVQNVVF